jgi:hypothetical protein
MRLGILIVAVGLHWYFFLHQQMTFGTAYLAAILPCGDPCTWWVF